MTALTTAEADPRQILSRWLFANTAQQAVGVAARMRLADVIAESAAGDGSADGSADVEELASRYDIPPRRLARLLRALASLGLCVERGPERFALTEAGALLRADVPGSLRELVMLYLAESTQVAIRELEYSIRTGKPGFDQAFGEPVFDYYADRPELSAVFNTAMGAVTRTIAEVLPDHYDFGRYEAITDIGGGNGTLLASVLGRYPHVRGVVFDSAEGSADAGETIRAAGLAGRCTTEIGDFFSAVPAGSDLYLLKSILHDWDDERAVTILRNVRGAVGDHGRLAIVELVLPESVADGESEDPFIADLNMLVLCGGQERTLADFRHLCARAEFAITDVVPVPNQSGLCVLEAAPV